ncbi:MAG: hypothetical protein ACJ74O_13795 [Frankiaceae bacterium]
MLDNLAERLTIAHRHTLASQQQPQHWQRAPRRDDEHDYAPLVRRPPRPRLRAISVTRRGGTASETMPMFELTGTARPRLAESAVATDDSQPTPAAGLPAVIDVETAGRLLGLGRSAAKQLVKDGDWPTPVLRLGRRWRVLTAPLLSLLGVDGLEPSAVGVTLRTSPTAPAIFRHNQGDQQ